MVLAVPRSPAPADPLPDLFPDPGYLLPDLDELLPELPRAVGLAVTSAASDGGGRVPEPVPAPAGGPNLADAAGSLVTSYMRPWRRRRRCRIAIAWAAAASAVWAGIGCPGVLHQPASPPGSPTPEVAAPLPAWRHPDPGLAPAAVIAAARARARDRRQRIKRATATPTGDGTTQHDPPRPPRHRIRHRDKDHPGGSAPGSTSIIRQAVLTAPGQAGNGFGSSVAVYGDTAVVGNNPFGGIHETYVYARTRRGWHRQARLPAPGISSESSDLNLAISRSTIVEGADSLLGGSAGSLQGGASKVDVLSRKGSGWVLADRLTPPDRGGVPEFGVAVAVAVSGSTIAIGSYTGVSVYVHHGSAWVREMTLPIPLGSLLAVALSGSTLVVSDYNDVVVFSRRGTEWSRQATLTAPHGDQGGQYGASVAVSGSTIVIGNPSKPEIRARAPVAYVYTRSGSAWNLQARLAIPRAVGLGGAVAVSGSTVVVAPGPAVGDGNPAVAYVFIRSAAGWRRQALTARSHSPIGNDFGWSVAVSGTAIMIGAPGFGTNDSKGAVYVFARRR